MSPQTSLLLSSMVMVTLVCVVIIMSYHGHGLHNYNDNITEIVLANDQGRFDSSQVKLILRPLKFLFSSGGTLIDGPHPRTENLKRKWNDERYAAQGSRIR